MTRSIVRCLLLAGLALGGFAAGAMAQQPTQAQASAIKSACRSDYQANCASVPTGGTAALSCLQAHQQVLSQACQAAVSAVGKPPASTAAGTAAPQAAPAPASSAPSTPAPAARTTPPPANPRQEAMIVRQSCGGDYRAYCAGVPMGGGRAIGCLQQNAAHLSRQCKGALAGMHGG